MKPKRFVRLLYLTLTTVSLATAAVGETVPVPIEVIGQRQRTIPATPADQRSVDLMIPVRLAPGIPAGARVVTVEVTSGGQALDTSAFRFRTRSNGSPGMALLMVTIDLTQAAAEGTYTVTVQPQAVAPPPGQKPSALAQSPAPLVFTFTKAPAELRVMSSPLRIERVVYLPGCDDITPRALVLSETAGKSPLILSNSLWVSELQRADHRPVGAQLRFTLPRSISAWGQQTAQLAVAGRLPLGTLSGTLTVRSPQLSGRSVDFPFDVVARISLWWLFLTLAASIALGYLVRTRLDARRQQLEAAIGAEQKRGELRDLVNRTQDLELRSNLKQVLQTLNDELSRATRPAALTSAADKAKAATEVLLKAAADTRTALRAKLVSWRAALGSPLGNAPPIEKFIQDALSRIAAQDRALTEGAITTVEEFCDQEESNLPAQVRVTVESWLANLESALDAMGAWPETLFDQVAQTVRQKITALRPMLDGIKRPENLADPLQSAAKLAAEMQFDLAGTAVSAVRRQAEDILGRLEQLSDPKLQPTLAQVRSALSKLSVAPADSPLDLTVIGERVRELRTGLTSALGRAFSLAAPDDPSTPSGLAEGRFGQALVDVLRHRPSVERDHLSAVSFDLAGSFQPVDDDLAALLGKTPVAAPSWTAALKTPERATAGEPLTAEVVLTAAADRPLPSVTVRWLIDGSLAATGQPGSLTWTFTPSSPGTVVLRAEISAPATGEAAVRENVLQVGAAEGFAAIPLLLKKQQAGEAVQTVVFGILIASIGFAILQGTFVGTFENFLAAVLWGFTVDIGLAKIREIAGPLLSRAPTFP
jgi:hypothetical protein